MKAKRLFRTWLITCMASALPISGYSVTNINGVVFESGHCTGLPHVSVRFVAPKEYGDPVVVTLANNEGRFTAKLPREGDYYVTVGDASAQVFGRVLHVEAKTTLYIALAPASGATVPQAECEGLYSSDVSMDTRNIRPEGLAFLPSGLVVLDSYHNRLLEMRSLSWADLIKFDARRTINIGSLQTSTGRWEIFVIRATIQNSQGLLEMYSDGGTREHGWWPKQFGSMEFVSLAADLASHSLYVAGVGAQASGSQLVKVDLSSGNDGMKLVNLGEISDPSKQVVFGAMAVDGKRGRLFAIDQETGLLYVVTLPADSSNKLRSRVIPLHHPLERPRAMAVSPSGDILYVAEGKSVWKLRVQDNSAQMEQFCSNHNFQTPSAIAIGPSGNVWIGDSAAHRIYEISPDGQIVSSVPR